MRPTLRNAPNPCTSANFGTSRKSTKSATVNKFGISVKSATREKSQKFFQLSSTCLQLVLDVCDVCDICNAHAARGRTFRTSAIVMDNTSAMQENRLWKSSLTFQCRYDMLNGNRMGIFRGISRIDSIFGNTGSHKYIRCETQCPAIEDWRMKWK